MGCNCGIFKIRHTVNPVKKKTTKEREEERERKLEMLRKMWEDAKNGNDGNQ